MTKEEKIELLEKEKAYMLGHGGDRQAEALDSAIKAMKQEIELFKSGLLKDCESCKAKQDSILDKITTEIQGLRGCSCSCSDGIIDDVEEIIDKYKAGSEG